MCDCDLVCGLCIPDLSGPSPAVSAIDWTDPEVQRRVLAEALAAQRMCSCDICMEV